VDFHLEHGLRLHTEPEHKGLYKWAINEIDAQGQQIGDDQIPWVWSLYFTATSCALGDNIEIDSQFQTNETTPKPPEIVHRQVIRVRLRPGNPRDDDDYFRQTTYSMFGTKRAIKSFQLDIQPTDNSAEQESCKAWGSVSYTSEIDFRNETTDDCIIFYLFVKPETFARYAAKVAHGLVDEMILRVGRVAGFYSGWSPSISTTNVKVLTSGSEQKITLPDFNWRLGHVGEAALYINRHLEFGKRASEGHERLDKTPEQIRRVRLDAEIGQYFEDGDPKHGLRSEYARALDAISQAALKHAEATKAPLSGASNSFEVLLEKGFHVVQNFRWAVQPFDQKVDENRKLKLWSHRTDPLYDVKNKKTPHLSRPDIETCVGDYLALPYRADYIDRLFVDVLIALEMYQYSDQMMNEPVIHGLGPPRSPLKQAHPLVTYLKGETYDFLFCVFLGGVVFVLQQKGVISDGWALGGYIVCATLFLLFLGLKTASLPFWWRSHAKSVRQVNSLMIQMFTCYSELNSDGPVSARHLLERLKVAADEGVAWPAPLFALLDDVMARTGRF
jgi:hypothetical protein